MRQVPKELSAYESDPVIKTHVDMYLSGSIDEIGMWKALAIYQTRKVNRLQESLVNQDLVLRVGHRRSVGNPKEEG